MYFMKAIAKFLTVITILVLLAGGYVIWAAEMHVLPEPGLVQSAADRTDAFEGIRQSAMLGSSDLTLYTDRFGGSAEDYTFVTYTLRMRNLNALPAEWLQIDLQPQDGDILLVKPTVEDIPAFGESLVSVVLLTSRSTAGYVRSGTLSYFVYGHEISLPLTLTT